MSQNTPINAIPYPDNSDSSRGDVHFTNISAVIDSRLIPRYATTAARDAANPSPTAGQVAYVTAEKAFQYRSPGVLAAGGWVTQGFSRTSVLAADDVVTSSTTPSAGTLTITLPAGRWELDCYIGVSAEAGVDCQLGLAAVGATSGVWSGTGLTIGATDPLDAAMNSLAFNTGSVLSFGTTGTGSPTHVYIQGDISTASAITVALLRAQNVLSATELTIHAGSFLRAARTTN